MVSVDVSVEGAVATVVFEKPGVLNALAPDDLPPLGAALRDAGSRDGVHPRELPRATADLTQEEWRTVVEGFHELTRIALALEVPVIAAIDGVCIGGAFEFACSCDLRVATTRSRFACPEVGIGLVISNASTVLLPRLCGAGYASVLMLTGGLFGANEAFDNGLLNAVVEAAHLEASVHALAEEIASRAPLAVRATKRLLVEVLGPAVEKAMARETEALVRLASTADMREGFAAFREKRSPSFSAE